MNHYLYALVFTICSLLYLSHVPIVDYIEKQFECYLQEELNIRRNLVDYHDTRIHACVYFIGPTGHTYVIFRVVVTFKRNLHLLG